MKKYFARANTASGCVNLMQSNLKGIKTLYFADGMSKTAKARFMGLIAEHFGRIYPKTECIHSPFDVTAPDGVIVRELGFAVIDAECGENQKPCGVINTDEFLACENGKGELLKKSEDAYAHLWAEYARAKTVHDEWEKLYIDNIDFDRLNAYSEGVIEQLLGARRGGGAAEIKKRFFGASTADGAVNYIDNITENLSRRLFIKGRPGTGKSTFLKKLASAAVSAGFSAEVYACSFDSESLDMTLIPELGFCAFDSTAPHELFPSGERDEILDFYNEAGLSGTDERLGKQLEFISKRYAHIISEGTAWLRLGNLYAAERELYLARNIDFDALAKSADKLIRCI